MRQREDALRQREETFRTPAERGARRRRSARRAREIDDVIAELKAKTDRDRRRQPRQRHRPATPARRASDARAAVDASPAACSTASRADRSATAVRDPQSASRMSAVGDRVIVGGLGLEGVVTAFTTARRTSTCAASGCARASAICASSPPRRAGAAARVNVNVELQPRETTLGRPQRHRLHGRRSDRARRAVSRRVAARPISASSGSFTATAPAS